MGTNLTSTQFGDLERLFRTPVNSGGDGNSYTPNTVNYNGLDWKMDGNGGYVSTGELFGDNQYKFNNYKSDGSFLAEGEGRMSDWDPLKEFALVVAAMAGGAGLYGAYGAAGGGVNPVMSGLSNTGAVTSGTAGLTGGVSSAASGGLNFSQGFTDGGTTGGALDTGYASGSLNGTGGVIDPAGNIANNSVTSTAGNAVTGTNGVTSTATNAAKNAAVSTATKALTGGGGDSGGIGGLSVKDLINLIGGGLDYNNQKGASEDLLAYLKERQGINDNMYKPGSAEYNALWDEMSRKDAAAGRNSQYGPRSVDLAARIAQIKMDANTKMTTGIGNLYKEGLDQGASAPAGLMAALNNLAGSGGASVGSLIDLISRYYKGGSTDLLDYNYDPATNPANPNLDSDPDVNGSVGDYVG